MRVTRKEWWHSIAQRREQLFLKLIEAKAPYQDYKLAVLEQEKALLRETRTPAERLHLQQITAKEVLTEAYMARASWEEFGPLLRRCQRLGFADLGDFVHVACLFAQALPRFPRQARQAFAMLTHAEQKLLRLRKSHFLRRDGLKAITHARRIVEAAGIAQPKTRTTT
ncbi:hypothetical protein [Hyalangium rubrum]|uniref:Uncharacterized protein n=1 Tax=Hyalangium rubrum TaxID=3103134 RepID=A0ABU5HAL8_9BACT|nr:hypothetical protein [Hyalangium sp. s54d21]MDY7230139.1 hypothetical protein [Hyalangium sp. s54d21]